MKLYMIILIISINNLAKLNHKFKRKLKYKEKFATLGLFYMQNIILFLINYYIFRFKILTNKKYSDVNIFIKKSTIKINLNIS